MERDEKAIQARKQKLLAEEAKQPMTWWYLSFKDETGWKGGIITRARGFISAIQHTHDLHINPGGEVLGTDVGPKIPAAAIKHADRLLSKEDLERDFGGAEAWRPR